MPKSLWLLTAAWCAAQGASPSESVADPPSIALQGLAPLIGEWQFEGGHHVFEWGPGRRSVRARTYSAGTGDPRLTSEAMWFWHPDANSIRGYATAIDMPFALLEYTTRVEGNAMVSELAAFSAEGTKSAYTERIDFIEADRYRWTLFQGGAPLMRGTFVRRK